MSIKCSHIITLTEPNATNVEKQKLGYIVAYLGELGGEVPYTAYNAKKSYIKNNPKIIKAFSNAINKSLKYVHDSDAKTIAEKIIDYFPDTSINDLITIIDRYKKADAWKKNINITEKEWEHIEEILISAKELDTYIPYKDLIYTKYQNINE